MKSTLKSRDATKRWFSDSFSRALKAAGPVEASGSQTLDEGAQIMGGCELEDVQGHRDSKM